MEKKNLRTYILNDLKKLTKQEYEQFSYEISCELTQHKIWQQANTIGITISRPPEVDTYQIIRKAWEQNKKVVVPKCHPKSREMTFHELNNFTQLESVYYGLLEPIEAATRWVPKDEIDLLIVPGLAYDPNGYRLGFGGGYYDRFLVNFKGDTVSLAFPIQLVDKLPIEIHDIAVKYLISCKGNS
jgi:5-formyltetrahydrofolate cyclo-ligase